MDVHPRVSKEQLDELNSFIHNYGIDAFYSAVYHGAFGEYALQFIHPVNELKNEKGSSEIQRAFIVAYT